MAFAGEVLQRGYSRPPECHPCVASRRCGRARSAAQLPCDKQRTEVAAQPADGQRGL